MSDDPLVSLEEFIRVKRESETKRRAAGGGHGPTDNDMEKRVEALEKTFEKIDVKLDKLADHGHALEVKLASIEGKMDSKASAEKVGEIVGRISELPGKWWVGTTVFAILFAASAGISAALVYLEKIRAFLNVH